jgi:hypothetical protein
MTEPAESLWFGVRSLFLFGKKQDGTNIIEERIVVYSGQDWEDVFAKAEQADAAYIRDSAMMVHPWREAYEQDGDALIDGYEVWSTLYETPSSLDEFVHQHYECPAFHPDP